MKARNANPWVFAFLAVATVFFVLHLLPVKASEFPAGTVPVYRRMDSEPLLLCREPMKRVMVNNRAALECDVVQVFAPARVYIDGFEARP